MSAACGVNAEPEAPSGAVLELAPSVVPPGQHRVHIVFTGSGTGRLEVSAGSTAVRCEHSCNIDVPDGTVVFIDSYAPSQFTGFTGACATTDFECVLTVTANVSVTAGFEFDDREVSTLLPEESINGVAFAADGNLIVATDTGVSKYRLDGKVAWTTPIVGGVSNVATDQTGRIFATSQAGLSALSPAGAVLWTQPVGAEAPLRGLYSMMSAVQLNPDGSMIAVRTSGGVATFHRNGTPRFHTNDGNPDGMAVAPDGTVAFGVPDDVQPAQLDLRRYSAAGTLLPPPSFVPGDDLASLAYAANGDLGSLTGAFAHAISVISPTLTPRWGARAALDDFTSPHGIAFDSSNQLVAVYSGNNGTTIEQYTTAGTIQFQTVKTAQGPFGFRSVP